MYIENIAIANPRITSFSDIGSEHNHAYYQIFFFVNDLGSMQIDGQSYRCKPRYVYFVPAGVMHNCQFQVGTKYYVINFHVISDYIADGLKTLLYEINPKMPVLFNHLLDQMIKQKYSKNAMSKFYQFGYFMTLLTALSDQSFSMPPLGTNGSHHGEPREVMNRNVLNNEIESLIEYINGSFCYSLSIDDMCNYLGYQRSQLFRLFKKRLGTTPHEYLNSVRINRAKELLKDMDIQIMDIAYIVGFQSPSVFRSVFKKIVGISPTEYRKKTQDNQSLQSV